MNSFPTLCWVQVCRTTRISAKTFAFIDSNRIIWMNDIECCDQSWSGKFSIYSVPCCRKVNEQLCIFGGDTTRYKMPRYSLDIALNSMFSKHICAIILALFILFCCFYFANTTCLFISIRTTQHSNVCHIFSFVFKFFVFCVSLRVHVHRLFAVCHCFSRKKKK